MKKKILVVDDDFDMVEEIRSLLVKAGYSVITAASGDECLKKAADDIPDLILLDVILSGAGGISVCSRLKEDDKTKDIPVIMVTGLLGESIQKKGHKSGADYVLSKPFDPADLLWEVGDVLEKKNDAKAA